MNGDGKPDLVVANQCDNSGNCNGVVGVLLGQRGWDLPAGGDI